MDKAAPKGVALGGFMATGKSTVGPLLAQRLELPFWDLDLEVEKAAGMSVEQFFQIHGEPAFRKMESRTLKSLTQRSTCVLSLGGGSLHVASNRSALAGFQIVVLSLPWATIERRLQQQTHGRPLATHARSLYAKREAGYASAGMLMHVDKLDPSQIVEMICERVGMGAV